jgi:signal transduction histidine kinase
LRSTKPIIGPIEPAEGSLMKRWKWNVWPPAIFAVIVLSFLASTGIVQWRIRMLEGAVTDVASTTAPSVEHLAAARAETRTLQILLREPTGPRENAGRDAAAVDHAHKSLTHALEEYLVLPVAPRERELWAELFQAQNVLDDAIGHLKDEGSRSAGDATNGTLHADVSAAATRLDTAIGRALEFNAGRTSDLTREIAHLRQRALAIAVGLDVVCTVIAIAGALLLRRIVRENESLLEQHLALQQERASELEQFAGRVAHDILSPLSTVGFALQLAAEPGHDHERPKLAERGTAALQRVKRVVSGLLDFARAGAKPAADVRAAVADVLLDLRNELGPTASAAGVELTMTQTGACEVRCNTGVLTSLIANLTRNAIKYIGDGPVRRVDVRAFERGACVRVEVKDTGPGLAPDLERRVFDAYARARNTSQPGIGLGLATVKRLAEAHGGSVGVSTVPGSGSTFWFELPSASREDATDAREREQMDRLYPKSSWSSS